MGVRAGRIALQRLADQPRRLAGKKPAPGRKRRRRGAGREIGRAPGGGVFKRPAPWRQAPPCVALPPPLPAVRAQYPPPRPPRLIRTAADYKSFGGRRKAF